MEPTEMQPASAETKSAKPTNKFVSILKKSGKFLAKHKKGVSIAVLSLILFLLITIVILPFCQNKIRQNQIQAVVTQQIHPNKLLELIPSGQLETTIKEKATIVVAIVDPQDECFPTFIKTLNEKDKLENLTTTLYIYPIIYGTSSVKKFYHLTDGLTLISFINQKEANRMSLTTRSEIRYNLDDSIMDLLESPQDTPKKDEKPQAEKEADNEVVDGIINQQSNSDEEMIQDEPQADYQDVP